MDPTGRFSNRAFDYVRGRPGYPPEIVSFLIDALQIAPDATVVDLGSGTGLSATPFLDAGLRVVAIEPNAAMREAGGNIAISGTAEATGLPDASADLVVAGQAFHWFNIAAAAREARRILRPPRNAAIFWNDRDANASALMRGYEALIERFNTDYAKVTHTNIQPDAIREFFESGEWKLQRFPNPQMLDRAGFQARVTSSSYKPAASHPTFESMIAAVGELFDAHQSQDLVEMHYVVRLFYGRLSG